MVDLLVPRLVVTSVLTVQAVVVLRDIGLVVALLVFHDVIKGAPPVSHIVMADAYVDQVVPHEVVINGMSYIFLFFNFFNYLLLETRRIKSSVTITSRITNITFNFFVVCQYSISKKRIVWFYI